MNQYSKEQIKDYLIDCQGYGEEDLKGMKKSELWDELDNEFSFKLYAT